MAEEIKTNTFDDFLVEKGYITQALFENIKKQSADDNTTFENVILAQKIMTPTALAQAKSAFLNIPYISLEDVKVDKAVLELLPEETADFYKFFAFERNDRVLKIAMTDPTNLQALEALEFLSKHGGFTIDLYVTDETSFQRAVSQRQNVQKVVGEALTEITKNEEAQKKPVAELELAKNSKDLIASAPISKIVDVILSNAIDGSASDIHIEPNEKDLRVRYRLDGVLHTVLVLPTNVEAAIISKIKILSNLKIDESRLPQDGRFHYETTQRQVDLRVSILPNINGEKIVMRILDKTSKAPTLEELGFSGKRLKWTMENIKKTHGIFLVTGPTGSGKSTTLYSILTLLNQPSVNIVTLEDPVEYFLPGVNQSQINTEIGLTFSNGLRSILRQDPNIIMVGEIRDRETAELGVQAALTGHLMFSTLHTNSAIGAIPRLKDMGVEPFLIVASMNAIAAQRLVRKICPDCKAEIPVTDLMKKDFAESFKDLDPVELEGVDMKNPKTYLGKGCKKCNETGYKGRIAIVEVLPVNVDIQELILSNVSPNDMYEAAKKIGMITMRQDGLVKTLKGITSYEEIVRVTSE